MQRAGHQRSVTVRATPPTPPTAPGATSAVLRLLDERLLTSIKDADSDCRDAPQRGTQHEALELAIRQRIESRLPGRVRNLAVRVCDDLVVLEGQCATFYTKQLAQHAAMGVLDDEHLENVIVVNVPK